MVLDNAELRRSVRGVAPASPGSGRDAPGLGPDPRSWRLVLWGGVVFRLRSVRGRNTPVMDGQWRSRILPGQRPLPPVR